MYWACRFATFNVLGVDIRSRVRYLCVRGRESNLFGEVVMSKEAEAFGQLDLKLNAAVAAVEDAKAVLRKALATERQLRASRGREAASVDPRQRELGQ